MRWLIAYDISDPRRLKRVAKQLERFAQRVQKSVFRFDGSYPALSAALNGVAAEINPQQDSLQAWPLAAARPEHDYGDSCLLPPQTCAIVVAPGEIRAVVSPDSR